MADKGHSDKLSEQNVLIYSDKMSGFDFGPAHPFKPVRSKLMMELLFRYSLLRENNQRVITPEPIQEDFLYLFHSRNYIDLLKKSEQGEFTMEMLEAGLGTDDNPVVSGLYEFCATAAGGTHQAAMMLLNDKARVVFNPIGGFHHAGPDHAEGFCYINDLAVAIADLSGKGKRIAYIDVDVHYGNGVRDAFAERSDVLCISIHESGSTLYPWSGFQDDIGINGGRGYTVNIPVLQGSDDDVYLYAFESIVPPILGAFRPDIVVASIGADTHREDSLGHLNLTSNGYEKVIRIINDLSPKLLATGGGGYNVYKTAALWALAWAVFCGLEPMDGFAGLISGMMYGPESHSGSLRDAPYIATGDLKAICCKHAQEVVEYLKKNVFPFHGI